MPSEEGYLLDNRQAPAGDRFDALARLFDESTLRHLDQVGLDAGWHCWEVGAGGPSLARAMARRVGRSGRVLATDIDTSWLDRSPAPPDPDGTAAPVVVRRHDIGLDPPPAEQFDLVHARLVLVHVPDRDRALATMVGTLRPGGVLLLEDADPALQPLICPDECGPAQRLANKLRAGFRQLLAGRAADLSYGRTLPRRLREAGLVGVRADAYFPIAGPAATALEVATVHQVRDRLVAAGYATEAEIEEHLANVTRTEMDLATAPMISAWGRRP